MIILSKYQITIDQLLPYLSGWLFKLKMSKQYLFKIQLVFNYTIVIRNYNYLFYYHVCIKYHKITISNNIRF